MDALVKGFADRQYVLYDESDDRDERKEKHLQKLKSLPFACRWTHVKAAPSYKQKWQVDVMWCPL